MEASPNQFIAKKVLNVSPKSIQAVLELAAEGATVPFIARYRKEKTGNLDEVAIRGIIESNEEFQEIIKRKAFLLKEISDQNNLTDEIKKRIDLSWDLGELEEIYRPFKKKKKTKATIAREAGLEPLANWIWDLGHGVTQSQVTLEMKAKEFLNLQSGIANYDLALKGATDIIVDKIANNLELRTLALNNYTKNGKVISKRTKNFKPNSKFEMYQDFSESVHSLNDAKASHRYLAMRRGWQEEELAVEVVGDDEMLLKEFERFSTTLPDSPAGIFLKQAAKVALTVYVLPSVTNEIHRVLKDKADLDAVRVFSENVRRLLLASPFGPKVVLGVDPGLRTGCKLALIDKGGNYISHTVMHTLGEQAEVDGKRLFSELTKQIKLQAIGVGNGTAGRETEIFLRKILKDIGQDVPVVMVNESGASVYSASDVAREEFPDLDVTVRGAISIARRLQDPLAELVKIDPKSIGVGQYQHDVGQSLLKKNLEAVVESCVNQVGVDLNTASTNLLAYVSGIGPALAKNIVEHRKTQLFTDRGELLKVPKLSTKVFEQAAGFLRIPSGKVVLDSTGIHPERYTAIRDMAQELGLSVSDLIGPGAAKLAPLKEKWEKIIGAFTFADIVRELEKPGRDPRDAYKVFSFRDDIFEVKDLKADMICPGIVTNVTNFGAFVDIGVHQDGLVHISELAHKFVDDPRKVVNPGDQVMIKVLSVDLAKKQISLTMKLEPAPVVERPPRPAPRPQAPRPQQQQQQMRQQDGRPQQQRSEQRPNQRSDQNQRRPDTRPQQQSRDNRGPRDQQRPQGGAPQQQNRGGPKAVPFNNPFANLASVVNSKK